MPENEFPKLRPHPFKLPSSVDAVHASASRNASQSASVADLICVSNYSFLIGGSHPEELVQQAAALGYAAIGLCDHHTMGGLVRAHVAAKQHGVRLVLGTRVRVTEMPGVMLALLPRDFAAYRRLCSLLTLGKARGGKGRCVLTLADVAEYAEGIECVVVDHKASGIGHQASDTDLECVARLRGVFDEDRLSMAVTLQYGGDDREHLERMVSWSRWNCVPLLATSDVLYHEPARRMLQDVVTCIRTGTSINEAAGDLEANAERHLREPGEMLRLFAACPEAIARAVEVADRCRASLDELVYEYPDEVVPEGKTPTAHLRELVTEAYEAERGTKARRYGGTEPREAGAAEPSCHSPPCLPANIEHELALIADLKYEKYFLTVHDIVRFARSRGILCQGRGAAANSAVCFYLGITSVDPSKVDLLFERFISKERGEPPDIDIDFEHERREEVIQYLYQKYGRDRAALTAVVITFRPRSAIRQVGKALGLSEDLVARIAKSVEWWDKANTTPEKLALLGIDPREPTIRWLLEISTALLSFPRHLSQHPGGFVITRTPLRELVPIEPAAMPDRTVIEWDKDDIDALGMLKVDVLGLGMLSCLRRCFELVNVEVPLRHCATVPLSLRSLPPHDTATFDMICNADTVGVFQIESRAQMNMLPRLRPRTWYDLVIEVAIVRPGPIQGDMVHPYLRRRSGQELIDYCHPAVERVLKKTLGVPLFQEQCMALAVHAAGFTPGEADQLRRAMAAWKRKGDQMVRFGAKLIDGMIAHGIPRAFAERCFDQIKGFSEYGFPESHAASFAHLVYASAYLKCHYPAHFACALINSQPMGFYQPAQIVRDAIAHGVRVLPVDVNASGWDCRMEEVAQWHSDAVAQQERQANCSTVPPALRLGMRLVSGLSEQDASKIEQAVREREVAGLPRFASPEALWRASDCRAAAMRTLAGADAFASMGLTRQRALWAVEALSDAPMPLFEQASDVVERAEPDAPPPLPSVAPFEQVQTDYAATGLSLKAHPVSFVRDRLRSLGFTSCGDLSDARTAPDKKRLAVAGLVLCRQRPSTASGIVFITLEDEGGIANLIVPPKVYEQYRRAARHSAALAAYGRIERQGQVVHVKVTKLASLDGELAAVAQRSRDFH